MLDFEFVWNNWLFIAGGVGETLGITILSFACALPVAALIAKGRRSSHPLVKSLSAAYILLIDGIPLYLLIFLVFLVLPQIGIFLPILASATLILTIYYSSRLSVILDGQFLFPEANKGRFWVSIIPQLTNEFNGIIKDTTIISMAGFVHDVMWRAKDIGRDEFRILEAYLVAIFVYLILITGISLGAKALTRQLAKPEQELTSTA
ncbi:MAG: ABC transporter permease subunit [Chloroflexi bacterium]|nr:ABC transporter permease subunit [Chloroflexota bacterium]